MREIIPPHGRSRSEKFVAAHKRANTPAKCRRISTPFGQNNSPSFRAVLWESVHYGMEFTGNGFLY